METLVFKNQYVVKKLAELSKALAVMLENHPATKPTSEVHSKGISVN
jgi:hypothetical protein